MLWLGIGVKRRGGRGPGLSEEDRKMDSGLRVEGQQARLKIEGNLFAVELARCLYMSD